MSEAPGSWHRHRIQKRLVDSIAWLTYREVAIDGGERASDGPVLLVSNHFGGAADAVVLMSALSRRPRILADAKIWKIPVAKQMMNWLGAIRVRRGSARSSGGSGGKDNSDMFSECHDALARHELVLIFPEGITRDEPSIGEVKSGAARIAIGAKKAGVDGLTILPVGIHYDDKAAFRSTVYINGGTPIDIDEVLGGDDAEDSDVESLTELIDERLRRAAPNYKDWTQERSLQMASEVFLRTLEPSESVPVGLRDRLADWMARGHNTLLADAASHYRARLMHAGVSDSWVAGGKRQFGVRTLLSMLAFLILIPYAVIGVAMHIVPILLTFLITKLKLAPAVTATIMPLAGTVIFGIALIFWMVVGFRWGEFSGLGAAFVMFPVSFVALVVVSERAHLLIRAVRNRLFVWGDRKHGLREDRQRLSSAVAEAVIDELNEAA